MWEAKARTWGASASSIRRCTPKPARTSRRAPGDLQSLRTWPSLGEIVQRQHIANSSYNALQVKAEKRLTGHVSLLASFVWSKSIDDADTVIPGFYDSVGAQDENNLRLERGSVVLQRGAPHQRRLRGRPAGGARLRAGAAELAVDRHRHAAGRHAARCLLLRLRSRQHRTAQPARYRARSQPDLAAQPAHHQRIFQYRRVHGARALHLRQCRTEHREWSGQQSLRHGLAPPVRDPGARRGWNSAPKPSIYSIIRIGESPELTPISARPCLEASWASATPAVCSSQFGTISK